MRPLPSQWQAINPMPEDELNWLIESKTQNAYLVAEAREAEAQKRYGDLVTQGEVHVRLYAPAPRRCDV
jgi:hypothetical protein